MPLLKDKIRGILGPIDTLVPPHINTDYPLLPWLNDRLDEFIRREPNPTVKHHVASARRILFGVLNKDQYYRDAMACLVHLIRTATEPPIHGPNDGVWKKRYGVLGKSPKGGGEQHV